ncbi:MAG TPA: hypothetical protein VFZ53_34535 [Polyangiaceae bacterium]
MSAARVLSTLALLAGPWLALGCEDDARCSAGEPCNCQNESYCFFECEGAGCNMGCNAVTTCGAVCEEDCTVECHDMSDCTTSCGDNCTVDCHNLDECGVICGPSCDYTCRDAGRCGVRAGSNSTINCTDVSSCDVQCQGDCIVECVRVSDGGCTVRCPGGDAPIACSGNRLACGSCS